MSKLIQTDKKSEDRPRDKRIKNLYDNVYLASFGRKFIKILMLFGLIQLIGSMPLSFAPCKGIQDSLEFWISHRGFRIPGS